MKCRRWLVVAVVAAVVLSAATVRGLINPHFTPIHLVAEAELIVSVELKPAGSKEKYTATIREVLKGKADRKTLTLDLSKALPQHADALRDLAAAGKPALFFVGEFPDERSDKGSSPPARRGVLHVSGQWAECDDGRDGVWAFNRIDDKQMQAVWAGGTDMLRRAVDYILEDDDPEVPVVAGAAWNESPVKIATVGGKIAALKPLDLGGDGRIVLFVASDQGDRLLACDAKTKGFSDLTAARRLSSKSQAHAWGDFSGNGRLDLVSLDGKALSLHAQQADGTFRAQTLGLAAALENGCVGLAAIDCGRQRCGLLVSTNSRPVLVALDADGKPSLSTLTADGVEPSKLGRAGPCLVADFDGDALPDVLQPWAEGSVLFRGQALGKFAPGVACALKLGRGESAACLADLDGDGRLDVFCVGADRTRIWQNEGGGRFAEYLHVSGEIAYISKPGGVDCAVGDIDNDGRQDVLIAYAGMKPQVFFNRGYRSFGHAHGLDLEERQLLDAARQGQQAACLGDFDGDGAQDMALALSNGEVWVVYRENEDHDALSVTAALPLRTGEGISGGVSQSSSDENGTVPLGTPCKGPLTVTGWIGKRCLGAWNVLPGTSQAFFGRREAGPIVLKWTLPGGKQQQKEILVENRPVRFEIR